MGRDTHDIVGNEAILNNIVKVYRRISMPLGISLWRKCPCSSALPRTQCRPIPVRDVRKRILFLLGLARQVWLQQASYESVGNQILPHRRGPLPAITNLSRQWPYRIWPLRLSRARSRAHSRRLKTEVCSWLALFPAAASTSNTTLLPAFTTAIAEASGWNSMLHLPPLPFPSKGQKPISFLPKYFNSPPFAARNVTPGCFGFIRTSGIHNAGQQHAPAPESRVIWNLFVGASPPTTAITSTVSTCPTFQIVRTSTTSSISLALFLDCVDVVCAALPSLVSNFATRVARALVLCLSSCPTVSASLAPLPTPLSGPLTLPFALPPLAPLSHGHSREACPQPPQL